MTEPNSTPVDYKDAIAQAIGCAAPERTAELHDLLNGSGVNVVELDDTAGFKLSAGAFSTVVLTARSMHQIWLLGHAAWPSLGAYAPLHLFESTHLDIGSDVLDTTPGQLAAEAPIAQALRWVEELRIAPVAVSFTWPSSVPLPDGRSKPASREDQAVFDLLIIAAAFIFLHELKHVEIVASGASFARPVDEELACDAFARDFLLDKVDVYAKSSGYDAAMVLNKRAAGIALGCFVLLSITARELWAGSASHPPVAERIRVLIAPVQADENALFWIFLAPLLLAVLRQDNSLPPTLKAGSWREACLALLEVLEQVA